MSWLKADPEVLKDIEEMNKGDFSTPESLSTDLPKKEEDPSTESPSTESPSTESTSTEAPTTDPPVEEEDDSLEAIRKELEDALSRSEEVIAKQDAKSPTTTAPIAEVNFLEKLGIDEDAAIGPKQLNEMLNAAYKMAREEAPQSKQVDVEALVREQARMIEVNRDFYENNPDLTKYKNFVSKVGDELNSKLSDEDKQKMELGEFLERVADESRRRLRIKINEKKKEVEEKKKEDKPKFPNVNKGKKETKKQSKLSPLDQEMAEMVKATEY
jgi:hypothetical protein